MSEKPRATSEAEGGEPLRFVCPGETVPISRAIHLGRLNAGWSFCDRCDWKFQTEGLSQRTLERLDAVREHRPGGVVRSEFGVRGQWLNELNSESLELLTAVFCHSLAAGDRRPAGGVDPVVSTPSKPPLLVAGFDGRSFSAEVFAKVIRTSVQSGFQVRDCGRSTHASILHCTGRDGDAMGGIFVSGAGWPTPWTGIDVFDVDGQSAAVHWEAAGIRLQQSVAGSTAKEWGEVDRDDRMVQVLREFRQVETTPKSTSPPEQLSAPDRRVMTLLFPSLDPARLEKLRLGRSSGRRIPADVEHQYRQWLAGWYPQQSRARLLVQCRDELAAERVAWLHQQTEGAVSIAGSGSLSDGGSMGAIGLLLAEDDRWGTFVELGGSPISVSRLQHMLGAYLAAVRRHVSVHTDSVTQRIWLSDLSGPNSGKSRNEICDILAVAGLLLGALSGQGSRL